MSLDDQELSAHIRRNATRHVAPDALRAGIRTQIAVAEAGRADAPEPRQNATWFPPRAWVSLRWRTAAVSFMLGLACSIVVIPMVPRLDMNEPLDVALVSDHVRALQIGPLTEVVSTDRHTVKPWFQGRLDYAPPVLDFGAEGFPLIGGRVEHVRGNAVATLAYARSRHVIDVFVWPSGMQSPGARSVHKGFNVLSWADGSMQYWAVSDLDRAEMERFAQLWRDRVAAQ